MPSAGSFPPNGGAGYAKKFWKCHRKGRAASDAMSMLDVAASTPSSSNTEGIVSTDSLPAGHPPVKKSGGAGKASCPFARLNVRTSREDNANAKAESSHMANAKTAAIVQEMGGLPALNRFMTRFYAKAFADPHLDTFIRSHEEPHADRFASWVAEMFGVGTPWTSERRVRDFHTFEAYGQHFQTARDRLSAHVAAWNSPKRDPSVWGKRFQLDTCRVWMRLHFWAAREEGVLDYAAFADYYCRFIGHFVAIYEPTAPPFARESMRWSADPLNTQRYLDDGRCMPEIMDLSGDAALATLPPEERVYNQAWCKGVKHWPYEL